MTPEEKAMNTAMCLHMSEFIALFFAPFMSITGKRKLPDMRIRGVTIAGVRSTEQS